MKSFISFKNSSYTHIMMINIEFMDSICLFLINNQVSAQIINHCIVNHQIMFELILNVSFSCFSHQEIYNHYEESICIFLLLFLCFSKSYMNLQEIFLLKIMIIKYLYIRYFYYLVQYIFRMFKSPSMTILTLNKFFLDNNKKYT